MNGSIQSLVNTGYLMEGNSIRVTRREYKIQAYGKNSFHHVDDMLGQDFLFFQVVIDGVEYSYIPVKITNNTWADYANKPYHFTKEVKVATYDVSYQSIEEEFVNIYGKRFSDLGDYFTIRFRFGVYINFHREDEETDFKYYLATLPSENVDGFLCRPGEISFEEDGLPLLETIAGEDIMALYPTSNGSPVAFNLSSEKAPSRYAENKQQLIWQVTKQDEPIAKKIKEANQNTVENGSFVNSGMSFDYADLSENGVLTEGDVYNVTRQITTRAGIVSCTSEPIQCKVVKEAQLAGFSTTELKVCPGKSDITFNRNDESYENETKWLHIKGNRLNVDSVPYASLYEVRYAWEYRNVNTSSWIELPLNESGYSAETQYNSPERFASLYSSAPQDLVIGLPLIKSGNTYEFRQVAYLEGFNNRKITARKNGVVTVTAYDTITSAAFDVAHMNSICADKEIHEIDFKVTPKNSTSIKSVQSSEAGAFNYTYSFPSANIAGTATSDSLNLNFNFYAEKQQVSYATVTINDGCGAIVILKDSLSIEALPSLDPIYVVCSNASTSIVDGVFIAELPENGKGVISISNEDVDFAVSDYYYSDDDVHYQKIGSRGLEVNLRSENNRRIYLKKQSKVGSLCESKAVIVDLVKVGAIRDNNIRESIYYVCEGSKNPAIACDQVSGGYGAGTYSYKWLYSLDNSYYKPMMSGEDLILTASLSTGQWDQPIIGKYYIKRVAYSQSGEGIVSDTSACAVISPYSQPAITLKADMTAVCYDSMVILRMSQDSVSLSELALSSRQGHSESPTYSYVTRSYGGEGIPGLANMTEVNNPYSLRITQDTVVYAKLSLCGKDIYSEGVSIQSGANLRPSMAYGACRVRGSKMDVKVINAVTGWEYSIEQGGEKKGTTSAEILVPEVGGLNFQVRVTNGNCEHLGTPSLDESTLHEPFRHFDLEVNHVRGDMVGICAGEEVTIENNASEGNANATNYEWSVDAVAAENNDSETLLYTFPLTSSLYKVKRISKEIQGGFLCQSIVDSVYVKTFNSLSGASLTLDNAGYVCPGESVKWNIGGVQGGKMISYSYQLFDNDQMVEEGVIGVDEVVSDHIQFTDGEHTLYVKVSDDHCGGDNKLYEQITPSKIVNQVEVTELRLKASPSLVNEDGTGKTTTVSITATAGDDDLTLDEFVYSYLKADGTLVSDTIMGGLFSIIVDSTSFTNDLLVVDVTRKNHITGCSSSSNVTISQTQGFMQRPSLVVTPSSSNYCAGEEVTISIPELPTFGDMALSKSDVTYTWLRNGSLVGSDTVHKARAVAGDTLTFICMISYKYDPSLRAAQIYSEEFKLVGKPGLKLGKVSEAKNGSKSMRLCQNDMQSQFTLTVDAEVGTRDTLEWQQSLDGIEWNAVPDTCRVEGDLSNAQSIELMAANYTKDISTKYFRLMGKSECGVVTYSTNIFTLKIDTIPSLPQVALRSGNVIQDNVKSVVLSPTVNYAGYSYHWGIKEDDLNQTSSLNGAQATVTGEFSLGKNSIYVYKKATTGAQCVSKTLKYDFDLYEELSIGDLVPTKKDTIRCPNEQTIDFDISRVKGGTGEYSIVWQYKTYGDNWIAFNDESENLGFEPTLYEGMFGESYQFGLSIKELSTTTSFRAIIACKGDYSGTTKMTNEYTVNYYEPLQSGNVDESEETICYGDEMSIIKGEMPSGGDGVYRFRWLRTATPDEEDSWTLVNDAAEQSYTKCDTMYESTYFKRIVNDGCGTTLESRYKLIHVMAKQEIRKEDVNYTKVVVSGSNAKMWGVPRDANDKSMYVWYDSDFHELDTTTTREIYMTRDELLGGDDYRTYTYYAAKLDKSSGCLSYNYDTLYVTAFENISGTIYVEGTEKESENKFWVCPGDRDVEVRSQDDPEQAEYRWYYRQTTNANSDEPIVGNWTLMRGSSAVPVRGAMLRLDTCEVSDLFRNATGRAKYVELKRVATFMVAEEETSVESNVIRINIVPTMSSVNAIYDLVGSLSTEQSNYCKGDKAVKVSGALEDDSETMMVWRNNAKYFGPWLYDSIYNIDEGFATWYESRPLNGEWDTVQVRYFNDNGYSKEFLPGEGASHVMNMTYQVRRAVNDGCTSAYTNILPLKVTDEVGKISNIEMYVYGEDGRSRYYKGFEIGDSLHVSYLSSEAYDCLWSLDSLFKDTLESKQNYFSFRVGALEANSLMSDPHIYMKRLSDGCWSSTLAVPVSLGSASDGGVIGYDQTVCFGGDFGSIRSVSEPNGEWKTPIDAPMKWSYGWQFSIDGVAWANISGADSTVLSAVDVNRHTTLLNSKVTYFRRVATNDSARVRYSNVVKMNYYDPLTPGTLSLNTEKLGFCTYDQLPTIISTEATGGRSEMDGVHYTWFIKMDEGDYYESKGNVSQKLNLVFEDSLMASDRDANIRVGIKCSYEDVCGTVESQPLPITLYRENRIPNIYQDNDSCDAQEVTVKVIEDAYDKTYMFVALLNSEAAIDSVIWSSETKERTIRRHNNMVVDDYAVYSVDETGCVSDYNYFNIDSLPSLKQEPFSAPDVVCYKERFTIKGGPAIGGNGEKGYAWQYSYDGFSWEDLLNQHEENLEVKSPMLSAYYRRIANDKCAVDTSAGIYVRVKEEVAISRDWLVMNDFKCEGQSFNIRLSDSIPSVDGTGSFTLWREDELMPNFSGATMTGFRGDSLLLGFSRVVVDSMGGSCQSDRITLYAHNAITMDHEQNVVTCENTTPCNGMVVDVKGQRQVGGYVDKLVNKWYVSKDGSSWNEQLLQNGDILKLRVEDTMYVRRLLYNGCQYDTSNTVTIIGSKVVEYDYLSALSISVVTDQTDGGVTLNMTGSKNFAEKFYFLGDGLMPQVQSNNVRLPYEAITYQDSLLQIIAVSDECVSQYDVTPLYGGIISFDGDTMLCGGGVIPSIVSTDVAGGHGKYTYQWQYRNRYTGNFINIDGADEKEYTPEAVSVATDYRRLTTDEEYTLVSNVITISIRPLPKERGISADIRDSVLAAMGLKSTQYSVERLPSMTLVLMDSITDVDRVTWQRSYDGLSWESIETMDADSSNRYLHEIDDTTGVVYYRTIGQSDCGSDTSRSYKVMTLYASYITDEELVLVDSICKGDSYVRIAYKADYSDMYEYSYRTIGYQGGGVYAVPSTSVVDDREVIRIMSQQTGLSDTTRVEGGAVFSLPESSFDVEVTRYVKRTGASSTKMIHFFVDDLTVNFSYVIDGVESHMAGGSPHSVRLNQGSKVKFTPSVKSDLTEAEISYKWWLIEPVNAGFYQNFGGSEGREGVTSEKESPSCYFNNPLDYTVKLMVTDGLCLSTAVDSAMYIDKATFRYYKVNAFFEDEVDQDELEPQTDIVIYPNPCMESLNVKGPIAHPIRLYDMKGTLLDESEGREVEIDMRSYMPGSYLLRVCDKVYVILKK